MQTKKNDVEILEKMHSDLKKLEVKRNELSEKLTTVNQKIKDQKSIIKNYEENTKMQLLTTIMGDKLTVAELRLLADAGSDIANIMKNLASVNNLPKLVQDISEFCDLEVQNNVRADGKEDY